MRERAHLRVIAAVSRYEQSQHSFCSFHKSVFVLSTVLRNVVHLLVSDEIILSPFSFLKESNTTFAQINFRISGTHVRHLTLVFAEINRSHPRKEEDEECEENARAFQNEREEEQGVVIVVVVFLLQICVSSMLFVKRSFAFHRLLCTPTTIQKTTFNTSSRRRFHHHRVKKFRSSFLFGVVHKVCRKAKLVVCY